MRTLGFTILFCLMMPLLGASGRPNLLGVWTCMFIRQDVPQNQALMNYAPATTTDYRFNRDGSATWVDDQSQDPANETVAGRYSFKNGMLRLYFWGSWHTPIRVKFDPADARHLPGMTWYSNGKLQALCSPL